VFRSATRSDGWRLIRAALRFFYLERELGHQALELAVLPGEARHLVGLLMRLEHLGGVGEQLVAPLVVLRLAELVLRAELADRRALQALEHNQRLRACVPFPSWHG